jgi:hypothetical protein
MERQGKATMMQVPEDVHRGKDPWRVIVSFGESRLDVLCPLRGIPDSAGVPPPMCGVAHVWRWKV